MFEWNSAYPQRELNQGDSLVSPMKYLYKPARKNFDRIFHIFLYKNILEQSYLQDYWVIL